MPANSQCVNGRNAKLTANTVVLVDLICWLAVGVVPVAFSRAFNRGALSLVPSSAAAAVMVFSIRYHRARVVIPHGRRRAV